jgi:nucleoside-triphosphatase THEP1
MADRFLPSRDRDDMPRELDKILRTGPPGCGKTTAVMKIVASLDKTKVAGLYTEEICEAGRRKGFHGQRR